jgi:hypothetical protein
MTRFQTVHLSASFAVLRLHHATFRREQPGIMFDADPVRWDDVLALVGTQQRDFKKACFEWNGRTSESHNPRFEEESEIQVWGI